MTKQKLVTVIAVVAAVGVLLLTLLAEPASREAPERDRLSVDPDELPSADATPGEGVPLRATRAFEFTRRDRKGRIVEFAGRSLEPLPDEVFAVTRPRARIYLKPNQVLEITADHGRVEMPDENPQRGELTGHVILTLFQAPQGQPLQFSPADAPEQRSPHVQFQLYIDDAPVKFDLELGIINSAGQVHLTSRQVDFGGRGLSLAYDQLKRQVTRLEIREGRSLIVQLEGDEAVNPNNAAPPSDQPDAASARPTDQPVTFYRATFERDVTVTAPDATLSADQMMLVFSFGDDPHQQRILQDFGSTHAPPPRLRARPAHSLASMIMAHVLAAPGDPSMSRDQRRSMLLSAGDRIEVKWQGALLVEPEPAPPREIANSDDAMIELTGLPARVHTNDNLAIDARTIRYFTSTGRLELRGDGDQRLVVTSPDLGEMTASGVVINQVDGTGRIEGGGYLRTITAGQFGGAAGVANRMGGRKGDDLGDKASIAWAEGVDLRFYRRDDAGSRPHDQLLGVRSAVFHRDVEIEHPELSLASERLALDFDPPINERPILRKVSAQRDVDATVRAGRNPVPVMFESQSLEIRFDLDPDGATVPSRLLASGPVEVGQPGQTLRAGRLDVTFLTRAPDPGDTDDPGEAGPFNGRIAVGNVEALEDVRVEIEDELLTVRGNRLLADGRNNRAEVFGTKDDPAVVTRDDAELEGEYISLSRDNEALRVLGPGTARFIDRAAQLAGKPGLTELTWEKQMQFDNRGGNAEAGLAEASGNVRSVTDYGRETGELKADELVMELRRTTLAAAWMDQTRDPIKNLSHRGRTLRQLTAVGDATLLAEKWRDEAEGELESRVAINGQRIIFNRILEQLIVRGEGSMLVQDQRPADRRSRRREPRIAEFSGRGKTAFWWTDRLVLDAGLNDLLIDGKVQMVHQPMGQKKPVQLDANYLRADLEETGGLPGWLSASPPTPHIREIRAGNRVRLTHSYWTIDTDQLNYQGKTQTALLRGLGNRVTVVRDRRQSSPIRAKSIKWNLRSGQFYIEQPTVLPTPTR